MLWTVGELAECYRREGYRRLAKLLKRGVHAKGNEVGSHYFVSYSRVDSEEFARRLTDKLIGGPPSYPVWLDVRDLQPGGDWDKQIRDAIRECQGLLFLMTQDSVRDYSGCEDEWTWALKYKKQIIPLRFDSNAELPFRLASREFIDFTTGFDAGLAKLRDHFDWLTSPEGVLRQLRFRLADAERELPRAREESEGERIKQDMELLRAQIAEQERVVADPAAAAAATGARIQAGIEEQQQPQQSEPRVVARAKYINPPPMTAPTYFQDRQAETEMLATFLREEDTRVITVVGRGGVGKTATVCRLLKGVETGRLPDELGDTLGELTVDGIVYLRTRSADPVSWADLFTDLCRLLPEQTAEPLMQQYRESHETPTGLMLALLEGLPTGGSVVVLLDNFEDLLDPVTAAVTDAALDEALRAVLSAPAHGVKVVITTRIGPGPLLLHQPGGQRRIDLDEGLAFPYAEQLLRARDPDGKLGLKTAPDPLLSLAAERTRGYPRALEALAAILSADRNTTLPELLEQTSGLPDNVVEALVGEAFVRLDPLAQQIMQAVAIFPVPVPAVAIDYLLQPYQPAINAAPVLGRLVNMQFVRRDAGLYYLHQVDRDYALGRIPDGQPLDRATDPPPFTRTALYHRGAAYFTQTQTPRQEWRTLDDLAPQLAEFELRYQGGDYDTAAQVLYAIDFDYLIQWGHYRYTIDLHTRLHGQLSDPATRAGSMASLGHCHYRLGDCPRAIQLHEQSLTIAREIGNRRDEAFALSDLGNCYSDLGQTQRAIDLYEQGLTIYRETGNRNGEAQCLGNLGSCYGTLGQTHRAIDLFEQALTICRETGNRPIEAHGLSALGECYADLGQWEAAVDHYRQAIEIADTIGLADTQAGARLGLAQTQLWAGDLPAARQTIDTARAHAHSSARAAIALLDGIIALRQHGATAAEQAFRDAIAHADQRLHDNPDDYDALYTKALALTGLTLCDSADHITDVITAFRAARALTSADGITARIHRQLDALAPADPAGILDRIRPAATGKAE
jgi:tetratricopeptide (TPR) repeat protein